MFLGPLARRLVSTYHAFERGHAPGHSYDRLINVPATMLTRSNERRARMMHIVRSLKRVNVYFDATGQGFPTRANATYARWKGVDLTPAQPQPIGAWIERWLHGSRVCRVFHSQGAFSVPAWQVQSRTLRFFRDLLQQVQSCALCEACHYLERVWHAVFASAWNGHHSTTCATLI
jgi:hypothetical protein